ncbi:MAG: zinc ribbon domain-containing protein [Candidatus Thermoplasmatota archaeon]
MEEKKKDMVMVQSGSFTATNLIFEQDGLNVSVYRKSSSTTTADIIMVVGFLISGFLIPVIVAVAVEIKSKNFARDKILPILKEYKKYDRRCSYCQEDVPFDAKICPYCSRKL